MKMLKIDLDFKPPKEWFEFWKTTRQMIVEGGGYTVEYIKTFETKRGHHLYIKIEEDIDAEEANKLQFLCGDDHTRVKINSWRIKRGIKHWNILFRKVLYRRKAKVLTCHYCGNKIPVPDKWFENDGKAKN